MTGTCTMLSLLLRVPSVIIRVNEHGVTIIVTVTVIVVRG